MLVMMSSMVITTNGRKTTLAQRMRRIEGASADLLTIAAQINSTRIDFLRPQIAHVLNANITGSSRVSSGNASVNFRC